MIRIPHIVAACLLLCTALPISISAQRSDREIYHFLNLPATAESAAVGGRSVSYIATNPGLAFDNPALLGQETSQMLYLSYMNYMRGMHSGNAFYGMPIGERGTWGVGLRFLQYGTMQGYDATGRPTGKFSASDVALQGSFSYDLSDYFRGGVSLKGLYSHLESYSSFGVGVDVGASYFNEDIGLSVGAAFKNVGAQFKGYYNEREALAWDFAVGISQNLAHAPFKLHLTAYGLNPRYIKMNRPDLKTGEKIMRHFSVGLEFSPGESFWLALGYNPAKAQDMRLEGGNKLGGLSIGAGFHTSSFHIGLSAASYHPSALSLMLTLSTNFGRVNEL